MRIYIIGSTGQLGYDLYKVLSGKHQVDGGGREKFDILKVEDVSNFFSKKFDLVINCAAFLDVVKSETRIRDSFLMNSLAPSIIAKYFYDNKIKFIHFSTDYVFNGFKKNPYIESDECDPLNMYGLSKFIGEKMILENDPEALILRTSGLYGEKISKSKGYNFVSYLIEKSKTKKVLEIVDDQILTPTWTYNIAKQVEKLIDYDLDGIVHCTDEGQTSWYDFAVYIKKILKLKIDIKRSKSKYFPPKRPVYSVLENKILKDNSLNIMRDWKDSIKDFLLKHYL